MNEYIFKLLNNNNNYFNHSQILATFVRPNPTNFSLNKSIELEKKTKIHFQRDRKTHAPCIILGNPFNLNCESGLFRFQSQKNVFNA